MKISLENPPRKFKVGRNEKIFLSDCGKINLADDEQVTFITNDNKEYDVARKSWGFYATPSINGRLDNFGFKTALVKNDLNKYFIMIVEKEKINEFIEYLKVESNVIVDWLDEK